MNFLISEQAPSALKMVRYSFINLYGGSEAIVLHELIDAVENLRHLNPDDDIDDNVTMKLNRDQLSERTQLQRKSFDSALKSLAKSSAITYESSNKGWFIVQLEMENILKDLERYHKSRRKA